MGSPCPLMNGFHTKPGTLDLGIGMCSLSAQHPELRSREKFCMSYCLQPTCTSPKNMPQDESCRACGAKLLLNDRYRATRVLGRGGFATTFLAIDQTLPGSPECVIKQLRPVVSAPHILDMSRELFQREAEILGKVGNHPQLPRLLDYFELEQEFYLIQEYVDGATLQQEVRRSGPFPEPMVQTVLQEVLPLMDYLHSQQVIHRDIKPANIIRRSFDNKLVLIDFGAVKDHVSQTAIANPQEHSTLTTFAVGTPGFAPPEQMAMRPVYASDVYSLGVTCVYLLTGKSPKDLNYDPTTGELSWRDQISLSAPFQEILVKMLEVSVRERYQSVQEVLQAMEARKRPTALAEPPSPTPSNGASPATRVASSIRAHNARMGKQGSLAESLSKTPGLSNHTRISASDPLTGSMTKTVSHRQSRVRSQADSQISARQTPSGLHKPSKMPVKMTPKGLQTSYNRGQRDFSGRDLRNLNLRRFSLSDAIFHEAMFPNADLRRAHLDGANLGRANLVNTNLKNAVLNRAYLSYADLEGADLSGAHLIDAHLSHANLRGANLCGANLTGALVTEGQLALARTNWMTVMPNGKRGRKGKRAW